jgi:hypothetical protein
VHQSYRNFVGLTGISFQLGARLVAGHRTCRTWLAAETSEPLNYPGNPTRRSVPDGSRHRCGNNRSGSAPQARAWRAGRVLSDHDNPSEFGTPLVLPAILAGRAVPRGAENTEVADISEMRSRMARARSMVSPGGGFEQKKPVWAEDFFGKGKSGKVMFV